MKNKLLLVSDKCPACKVVKKKLDEKGHLDDIQVVDVETKEGRELANRMGIRAVPECVMVESEGEQKVVRKCKESEWRGLLKGDEAD